MHEQLAGPIGVVGADAVGELALKPGWPSMFRGYLNDADRYAKCFRDGWYLSGDLARSEGFSEKFSFSAPNSPRTSANWVFSRPA
jgi:hypothetical protein